MRSVLARTCAAAAVIAAAWAGLVLASGGIRLVVAGVHVSSTNAWKPFQYPLLTLVIAVLLHGLRPSWIAANRFVGTVTPLQASLCLATATVAVGLVFNSWTASGPDPFAYVSQAALWRHGQLDLPAPLAPDAPWPDAVSTFAPFGYRPAPAGAPALVPITAPGVPMAMALLQYVAGHRAAFLVAPFAGGALVLLTFGIGRQLRSPSAGLIAAALVATSPAVLYMVMWPMSDVPAAAVTALLIWCVLRATPGWALAAGLAASMALLTRPNLVFISAAVGLWLLFDAAIWRRGDSTAGGARRVAAFGAGLIPGLFILVLLNVRWFGSPFASGYGTAGQLFAADRIPTNARLFATWLLQTSPVAWLGVIALCFPAARFWRRAGGARAAWLLRLVVAAAVSLYLVYEPHAEWWYLRFLLPAWPALFVATALVIDAFRVRGRTWAAGAVALTIAAGVSGVVIAQRRAAFEVGEGERRYVTVAALVDANTEASAVILTWQHSGTIRYYAGRETLRFDVLDGAWLDRAITWLAAKGRHPYVLVEDWEQPAFEARFRRSNQQGDLSYPPIVAWQSVRLNGWVWLYDPLQHAASTEQPGAEVETNRPRCADPKGAFF